MRSRVRASISGHIESNGMCVNLYKGPLSTYLYYLRSWSRLRPEGRARCGTWLRQILRVLKKHRHKFTSMVTTPALHTFVVAHVVRIASPRGEFKQNRCNGAKVMGRFNTQNLQLKSSLSHRNGNFEKHFTTRWRFATLFEFDYCPAWGTACRHLKYDGKFWEEIATSLPQFTTHKILRH